VEMDDSLGVPKGDGRRFIGGPGEHGWKWREQSLIGACNSSAGQILQSVCFL
jgi:hypothetical protein